MKIKIKMDKKVLAEVPAAYALAGGAAGLIFAPKITLAHRKSPLPVSHLLQLPD